MGNELKIFENEMFGTVRTIKENNKVLFCGSDMAKALDYTNPRKAILDHCRCVTKRDIPHPQSKDKMMEMSFIPESDVYRLIVQSKLPSADKFERWIFDDVLPTIRQTGGYVANEDLFINTYLLYADENTKKLFKLNLQTISQLNNIIAKQKPLVDFAETVSSTKDIIDMNKMAKLLNDENIPIGRNKLFEWLRTNKILMNNNTPYQKYIDGGYFKIKESIKETAYGTKIFVTTYVTGKGQIYIIEKLRKLYKN